MGPLGVHPIMKKQGLGGAFAQGLNAIILKYAGAKNFSRFTQFSTSGLGTAWNFTGFDIAAGAAKPMVIPTLPAGTTFVAFFRGFTKDTIAGDFRPATESPDNLGIFANAPLAKTKATPEQREAALEAIVKIESPAKHSPNTIDCASCHAAQPERAIVAEGIFNLSTKDSPSLFVATSKWVPGGGPRANDASAQHGRRQRPHVQLQGDESLDPPSHDQRDRRHRHLPQRGEARPRRAQLV